MAETRAKARALRDATNIAMAAVEELGEDEGEVQKRSSGSEDRGAYTQSRPAAPATGPRTVQNKTSENGATTPAQRSNSENGETPLKLTGNASGAQLGAIRSMCKINKWQEPEDLETWDSVTAGRWIQDNNKKPTQTRN